MSVKISFYRVSKAENLNDIINLDKEIDDANPTSVNLEVFTQDLAMIFSNSIDPFRNTSAMYYKLLFGNHATKTTPGYKQIGGFIPASEIPLFMSYIVEIGINTYEKFSDIYDNLSHEVKQELVDMGSPDKKSIFDDFLNPLTELYFDAHKNNNAIVICGT